MLGACARSNAPQQPQPLDRTHCLIYCLTYGLIHGLTNDRAQAFISAWKDA